MPRKSSTISRDKNPILKYRNFPPAKKTGEKVMGRIKFYHLTWTNYPGYNGRLHSKWVRASRCTRVMVKRKPTVMERIINFIKNLFYVNRN